MRLLSSISTTAKLLSVSHLGAQVEHRSFSYKGIVGVIVGRLRYQDGVNALRIHIVSMTATAWRMVYRPLALYRTRFRWTESTAGLKLAESSLMRYSVPASGVSSFVSTIPNGISVKMGGNTAQSPSVPFGQKDIVGTIEGLSTAAIAASCPPQPSSRLLHTTEVRSKTNPALGLQFTPIHLFPRCNNRQRGLRLEFPQKRLPVTQ